MYVKLGKYCLVALAPGVDSMKLHILAKSYHADFYP
jgi:hypothetical protein